MGPTSWGKDRVVCGVAGIFRSRAIGEDEHARLSAALDRMKAALESRGPDQQGAYADREAGIFLGHRRLSILDPSEAGRQPMWSQSGRYAIVYNGEIYNYLELRRALERQGHGPMRTGTDTEVLLEAVAKWGCERALEHCNGMFAFGLWDREAGELTLARDRFGIKPLYYRVEPRGVVFASEVRALIEGAERAPDVDLDGVGAYLAFGFLPKDHSIYEGVRTVESGTLIRFSRERTPGPGHGVEAGGGLSARSRRYFDVCELAEESFGTAAFLPEEEMDRDLEGSIRRSIVHRMRADVPVGLMLSGGVDSSLVAAIAGRKDLKPKAFTLGFDDPAYDETVAAGRIASYLGLEHRVERVTGADAQLTAQECLEQLDEPFGDQSLIPTLMLSTMVGREVKVCLSGDGGDELFGGYGKYRLIERMERRLACMPRWLRVWLSQLASPTSEAVLRLWPKTFRGQRAFKGLRAGKSFQSLARTALERSPMINRFVVPEARARVAAQQESYPSTSAVEGLERIAGVADTGAMLQLLDQATYLTDNILRKTDRASMARSVEVRVPLLDPDVVGVAWRIKSYRLDRLKGPLRRILERNLPSELCREEKKGFSPPMARWLTGGLRDWGEAQLEEVADKLGGFLDRGAVFREWRQCQRRGMARMQAQEFWSLIMLNCLRTGKGNDSSARAPRKDGAAENREGGGFEVGRVS